MKYSLFIHCLTFIIHSSLHIFFSVCYFSFVYIARACNVRPPLDHRSWQVYLALRVCVSTVNLIKFSITSINLISYFIALHLLYNFLPLPPFYSFACIHLLYSFLPLPLFPSLALEFPTFTSFLFIRLY